MDRSLDEIIGDRPPPRRGGRGGGRGGADRRPPPPRAPRREEYPRDGVRKPSTDAAIYDGYQRRQHYETDNADQGVTAIQYRGSEPANIDSDWVHDRFEDDKYDRRRGPPIDDDRMPRGPAPGGTKVRVDNIHYELTEDDLRELFERVGPVLSVHLLYDRNDRSQGTAYVIYDDHQDAREAVRDFDGQNANGQPIRLSLMPSGPSDRGGPRGSLMDRIEKPPRSLFDRIEDSRDTSREDTRRKRRGRSDSPRKAGRPAPPDVDRYMPGRGSRSPIRRRGTPREGGRRPGQRREETTKAPRRPRADEEGRPLVGGRPRKTAQELDAEMADYWGNKGDNAAPAGNGAAAATTEANGADIDMDI